MHKIGKKVGILNIGSELLVGHTLNTHASYLSNELNHWGYSVYDHVSVGDNVERIKEALSFLAKSNTLIICTGGLGPTLDDITRDVVADFMGLPLIKNEEILSEMKRIFQKKGIEFTENNSSQAYFPEGASILPNPLGTAAGFMVGDETLSIICLPGPPRELEAMMKPLKELLDDGALHLYNKFLHIYGIGESKCADKIDDIFASQTDPSIGIYASPGLVKLRLSTMKESEEAAEAAFRPLVKQLEERISEYIFSTEGEDLNEKLYKVLKEKNLKISFAESCTGGLCSKFLTEVSGASQVFDFGLVTYSNMQKMERLGVSKELLNKYGAVSEECVIAMNEGLNKLSGADICVSISGVSGPGGGTEKTPVGTVKIAISYRGKNLAKSYRFPGDRTMIREHSCRRAFFEVLKLLKVED